jgi:hypothetical protein
MAARCLCCLADQGSEIREIAVTSSLWSVHSWKSRPSKICLKCLIVWEAARSSRSNVDYLVSATLSLREKKPNGCQEPLTCCCSTPPMCVSEASVATEMAASGAGCATGTTPASTCLLLLKVASRWGDHCRVFLPPLSAAVRGSRTTAISGMKRR